MDLKEIGYEDVKWIDFVQDRVQWRALIKMVMNLWLP
jgi:hypothetical protein